MLKSVIARVAVRSVVGALAVCGTAMVGLAVMIAQPTRIPPPLKSIDDGARAISREGVPELKFVQARDGTYLGYRLYEPTATSSGRIAILAHGSSAQSVEMHDVGRALAAAGVRAIAIDVRGHGHSGTRGDIAYMGQLDDDLADTIAFVRKTWGNDPITFVGHSIGGGFGVRTAGGENGKLFAQYVLLAPMLTADAPTSRPASGGWAAPNIRRITALTMLERWGIHCCDSLPVIGYALPDSALPFTTRQYSYRLLANYSVVFGYKDALARIARPVTVIAGADDELMIADRYAEVMQRPGLALKTVVLPGVTHMGVVYEPAALQAIVAAVLHGGQS